MPSALLLSAVALFIASRFSEAGDFPPKLPGGKLVVSVKSADLLAVPSSLKPKGEYTVAKTPPEVDVLYYPEQNSGGNCQTTR
ncbi:MAG: hypothetical protein QF437_27270 [Planctomycetota bacterium]|jgi:hypothetical protein|nr:hypothetical protein [Planctomycetota bacterium]MDP7134230.1 hypothetical protein [Planctomycetota bacterium]MDP7251175.1 hypothetical protein [Planctomycetota bacterium]